MRLLRLSTQIHKWVALVVGIQVLFWVAGGLLMTAIPIEVVRSEHHQRPPTPAPLPNAAVRSLPQVVAAAGFTPVKAELKATARGPAWVLTPPKGETVTLSATTAAPFPPLTPPQASALALAAYQGEGRPVSARLMKEAPQETGRSGPIWRVDFNDAERTTFYLSPATGEVVTRRSAVWRLYDAFWRLHIMDLKTGENFNHPLIVIAAALTLGVVITGFVLLWIRLVRDWKAYRTRTAPGLPPSRPGA